MRKCLLYSLIHLLLVCCLPFKQHAQNAVLPDPNNSADLLPAGQQQSENNPLFTTEEVLEFKLYVNFQELLKDRDLEREYHKATLTYKDAAGSDVAIDLKVMVRGSHRRDPSICRFPPIMLNFSKKIDPKPGIPECKQAQAGYPLPRRRLCITGVSGL